MKNILISFLLLFTLGCTGVFVDKNPDNTATENFNVLWKELDEHYCYFAEKQVDWQALRSKYLPQINDNMSDTELFEVCSRLLAELKDPQVNLITAFNSFLNNDMILDYPKNFNEAIIEKHYLGKNYINRGGVKAKQIDNIGYIYYPTFLTTTSTEKLDHILHSFSTCKGIILDIRNNNSGSSSEIFKLAERFTDKDIHVGYSKYKTGKGHADFSKLYGEKVSPSKHVRFTKPIVLITNRSTYKAANIFAGIMKNFPNVTQIGDTTGGGSASAASFTLQNGWKVNYSSINILDIHQKTFESGIVPAIIVTLTKDDESKGIDTLIEEALKMLNK